MALIRLQDCETKTKGTVGRPYELQEGLGGDRQPSSHSRERSLAVAHPTHSVAQSPDDWLSVPKLIARGWTKTLIRRLLGTPDRTLPNPYARSRAPMRLYARTRVEAVEASPAWFTAQERAARRKAAAAKAVETKTQRLLDDLLDRDITVPVMPLAQLIEQACAHYNDRQLLREHSDAPAATPASDPSFLARISVDYLRHCRSPYEQELARQFRKVGSHEAYLLLNDMVYDAIATAYPTLAAECARQRRKKHDDDTMRELLRRG
jgi:hypothetical protein